VWLGLALASATVLAGSEKPGDTPASPPGSFGSHSAGWFSPENRHEDATLANLKAVQKAVQAVVDKTTPAVVSISDGGGYGSGVIVSREGLILTAGHVVNTGISQFDIFFSSGQTAKARLVGFNLNVDAA
ncbi:MAG: hypothetical protein ACK53V_03135, partial [Planctomycetota bacterium]